MEELIINLYQDGLTISKIAKQFNISEYKTRKILIKNNIQIINRRQLNNINKMKIAKQLYKDGFSIAKIAKQLCMIPNVISQYLKMDNIQVINRQNQLNFEISEVINLYSQNLSVTKIAHKLKTTRKVISKILKNNGLEITNKQNETKFNETVFDDINSEEKAYWLGFLYADGSLSKTTNTIELGLKTSDKTHLQKYLSFLKHTSKNKIKFHTNKLGNSYRVSVTNKHTWNVLNTYGCTPKKSLTLKFPNENIFKSPDLIRHFIRGYFDGDGCLSYNKTTKTILPKCSIISTFEFLSNVQQILKNSNINGKLIKDKRYKHNTRILDFSSKESEKLINYLYDNSTIYLTRKYNRYLFFKESCRSLRELNELLMSEIGES